MNGAKSSDDAGEYRLSARSSFMLDLVRMLAAQAVLVGHLWSVLGLMPALSPPRFAPIQNVAVLVFFLLSGLLISYTVLPKLDTPGFTMKTYMIDRFARIYSGLLPALAIIAVVDGLMIAWAEYGHAEGYSLHGLVGNVLMLQDYPKLGPILGITSFGSARVLWTLAVEWWLYVGFAWLAFTASGPKPRSLLFWLLIIAALPVLALNLAAGRGNGLTATWILGVAGYLVLRDGRVRQIGARVSWACAAFFLLLAAYRLRLTREAYDLLLAALLMVSLTMAINAMDLARFKVPDSIRRAVRFLADYSFTLYLIHLTIMEATLAFWLELRGWQAFAVIFLLANGVAALIAIPTEMRHRQLAAWLKSRFDTHPKDMRA